MGKSKSTTQKGSTKSKKQAAMGKSKSTTQKGSTKSEKPAAELVTLGAIVKGRQAALRLFDNSIVAMRKLIAEM